ncbi:hypothetical protein [Lysobacter antibioticus]|uniref:hypothetical protein n=1 Tax=Lysobacter antibioticus TaxID=84531 RepID=UPI000ACE3762|nr:hypothetical protein [Lysobacter antibioticus]
MRAASVVQDMLHELPRYLLVLAAVSVLALLAQAAAPSSPLTPSPLASPNPSPLAGGRDARPAPIPQSPLAHRGDMLRATAGQPLKPAATASPAHGESHAAR